ncbi:unnamed protein product, partial [Prorocentrum cordatum]
GGGGKADCSPLGQDNLLVCLRCTVCRAVFAGNWKWPAVPEDVQFPRGFHSPVLASTCCEQNRCFFATPQVVVEVTLLSYLLGFLARGGMSFTAFAVIYQTLWPASMRGTMYASRTHLLQIFDINVIAFACILMFAECALDARAFVWCLRPRHQGSDFEALLCQARKAFSTSSASHACWLFRRVRALVVDGKWCVQTSICNARDCNPVFSAEVREGYFKGCTERPAPGSLYCKRHAYARGHRRRWQQSQDALVVEDHRKTVRQDGVLLEYKVQGGWARREAVNTDDVRQYEMWLLRRARQKKQQEDDRKDVDELLVGRKSAGIFVAVTPCLQIAAIAPMWASESISQLLLFLLATRELFLALACVIYDNACAVARHLRKRQRESPPSDPDAPGWTWLLGLQWVVDRLHFTYRKGCRDKTSPYFAPGVDADDYPSLKGVDTEAVEQLFHVANRWQVVLSGAHPVHEELLLLIFARDHNRRQSCHRAIQTYRSAQAAPAAPRSGPNSSAEGGLRLAAAYAGGCECDVPDRAGWRKKRKTIRASCEVPEPPPPEQAPDGEAGKRAAPAEAPRDPLPTMRKQDLHSAHVWINLRSKTVHHAVLRNSVSAGCGYFLGQDSRPLRLGRADVRRARRVLVR